MFLTRDSIFGSKSAVSKTIFFQTDCIENEFSSPQYFESVTCTNNISLFTVPGMPPSIQAMVAKLHQERRHEHPNESMMSTVSFGTVTESKGLDSKNERWAKLQYALLKSMYDFLKKK